MMRYITYMLASFLMCGQPLYATDSSRPEDAVRAFINHMTARNTNAVLASFWITSDGERECVYDKYVDRREPTDDFSAQPLRTFVDSDCALCVLSVSNQASATRQNLGGLSLVCVQDKWLILPPGADSLSKEQQERHQRLNKIFDACRGGADRADSADKSSEFLTSLTDTNGCFGTWSNGRGEFNTVWFSLGHNGQGIFGTAVAAVPVSWIRTTNGIIMTAEENGSSAKISFELDSDNHVFWSTNSSGLADAFVRGNAMEPSDYETQGEEQLKKEHEEMMQKWPLPLPMMIATPEELISQIHRLTTQSNKAVDVTISSANKKRLLFRDFGISGMAYVRLDTIRVDNVLPFSTQPSYSQDKPACAGKEKVIVSKKRIAQLQDWLAVKKFKKGVLTYELFRTPWRVTGYTQVFHAALPDDSALQIEAIKYLIKNTLSPFDFPVEFEDSFRQ